ncbi:ankyrin repeat-containing domain protein [Dunaliella salina]|uniref:Ankyrin repeat-containing domain protein n=1 Tax=Dunaliella salina TaxID=3046 RepID=A0ABQ7GL33_DUNSA|nr:ankyrin repeat-containing domain protein [Dunaliella salina]|eukprot:KAF5835322.1 ankyrin repeat-containing domain protein [Dunaliella salina]
MLCVPSWYDTATILQFGATALLVASQFGREDCVQRLLKAGAATEMAGIDGATALSIASEKGYKKVVQLLLDAGAPVNLKTHSGLTPMQVAAAHGQCNIARMLCAVALDRAANGHMHTKTSAQPGSSSPGANAAAQESAHSVPPGGSSKGGPFLAGGSSNGGPVSSKGCSDRGPVPPGSISAGGPVPNGGSKEGPIPARVGCNGRPSKSQAAQDAATGPSGQRRAVKTCLWCGASGKQLKRCSGCGLVWLCGTECQNACWPSHRVVCKEAQRKARAEQSRVSKQPS